MDRIRVIAVSIIFLGLSCPALAAGKAWVHIEDVTENAPWKAHALEAAIFQYLSGFQRISAAENIQLEDLNCEAGETKCILQALRKKNVDVAVLGQLKNKQLALASYETWTDTAVANKNIPLNGTADLTEFRHEVYRLIKPFVDIGGLFDQHPVENENPQSLWRRLPYLLGGLIAGGFLILFFNFSIPRLLNLENKSFIENLQMPFNKKFVIGSSAAFIILGFLGVSVGKTIRYHKIYSTRMEQTKLKIKEQERQNGRN